MAPMVVIARSDVPVVEAGELPDFLRRGGVRIAASTFMERHGAMALADAAATTLIGVAAPSGVVRAFVEDRADVACVTAADAIDPVRAGDVRALIVAGEETLPAVWDAPSAVDAGLPLFAAASWSGLYVTSEAVGWSAWLAQRHDDADVQRLLGESGQTPPPKAHRGAEAHAALLGATRERAEALARSTGLTFP
jgi:tripartite-type tricarboxylate transporter receptor subunit TctC